MMGERDPQKQLWSYQVNLDKRVRSDQPLRRTNETLELDFVRREVAKFWGSKGNVSENPVVFMKMMLLLFFDNVRSERELMRIIPERLDYMWFLGYGLEGTVPNDSVLSKARNRWSQEVFVALPRMGGHFLWLGTKSFTGPGGATPPAPPPPTGILFHRSYQPMPKRLLLRKLLISSYHRARPAAFASPILLSTRHCRLCE